MTVRQPATRHGANARRDEEALMAERQIGFRPGGLVHYIQARLASGDPDSWEDVDIVGVGDDWIAVRRAGEEVRLSCVHSSRLTAAFSDPLKATARLSARWHLLSVVAGPTLVDPPAGDYWQLGD